MPNRKTLRKKGKKGKRRQNVEIGLSYLSKAELTVTYPTTFQAVGGSAVAQGVLFTTASVFTGYPGFTTLVSNIWQEYRVTQVTLKFSWTFNVAQSGLYIPTMYVCAFRGDTAPTQTLAGISAIPWHRESAPPRPYTCTWIAPSDDPEAWIFRQTTAAVPITGGIAAYIGAAAPTSTVAYLVVKATYKIQVRSRKL